MTSEIKRYTCVESPFKGIDWSETQKNILYARACAKDCLDRGEVPYATHLFFTQRGLLDDRVTEERNKGIRAGKDIEWLMHMASQFVEGVYVCSAFYTDRGMSHGMEFGLNEAKTVGRKCKFRKLGKDWEEKYREFLESKDWMDLGLF
jgi:hypothetical protein